MMPTEALAISVRDAIKADRYELLKLVSEEIPASFTGREGECHGNAEAWIAAHPEYRIVQGYVGAGGGRYAPHSVVKDGAGQLFDVTWERGAPAVQRRFVRHEQVSQEPFVKLACIELPLSEWPTEITWPADTLAASDPSARTS